MKQEGRTDRDAELEIMITIEKWKEIDGMMNQLGEVSIYPIHKDKVAQVLRRIRRAIIELVKGALGLGQLSKV